MTEAAEPTPPGVNADGEITDGRPEPQIRPFAAVLQELDSGATHAECSDALHDLVDRVRATGKKGTLTLKLTVTTHKGGYLIVADDVAVKAPEPDRADSIFFVDRAGNLSRSNPNQPSLPLSAADRKDNS
jgi:hypothetical protein